MSLKQTISIEDLGGKAFQIRLVEGIEVKAVVTHYLHNYKNGVKKHYEKDALSSLRDFVEYKQIEEEISIVAEDALQQLLFEVEGPPFPSPENYSFKFIDLFAGIGGFRLVRKLNFQSV
jgi:DNA (cytosine-5)-methyltransferase 1